LNEERYHGYHHWIMASAPSVVPGPHHIFLSHAGVDTQAASEVAELLRLNGMEVWLDKHNLHGGERWMATVEDAIQTASAMLVYVGRLGVQMWVDREVRSGLIRNTQTPKEFPLIPVLGDGAIPTSLPFFLQQHQFIDLRNRQRAPDELRKLIEILKDSAPDRAIPTDYWTMHSPFRGLQVFQPEDSWLFFGRDMETADLIDRLTRGPILAVLGNSGSGKSSLIRAGLLPALRRGRFRLTGRCYS
jgi:hypothetical protein